MKTLIARYSVGPLSRGYLIKLCAMIAIIIAAGLYFASRFTVGIDTQTLKCLPYKYYMIDTTKQPDVADLSLNEMVAVRLTEAQRPAHASWTVQHTMVKRVLAKEPGTRITIRQDGISFEFDDQHWTHGTGLEAADMLRTPAADYERVIVLKPGEVFLMGDLPMSYDGRYYGPITQDQIVGTVPWAF